MDQAARELGMDRAEFRKKNFITKFPHQQCLVHNIDSGDYNAHFNKALELADYKGFAKRKAESAAKGKLRGIGFSTYIEACGIALLLLSCQLELELDFGNLRKFDLMLQEIFQYLQERIVMDKDTQLPLRKLCQTN